jgi:hypothetical protein
VSLFYVELFFIEFVTLVSENANLPLYAITNKKISKDDEYIKKYFGELNSNEDPENI